jgi:allantoinase
LNPFAIHSNRAIINGRLQNATVVIENGIISNIITGLVQDAGIPLTDVHDDVLMPGVIDPHVHINEPGRTDWEGFNTATKAAAAGGISLLVDMPLNSSPVTTTADAWDKKIAAAKNQLHTNCGFWGGIIPGHAAHIKQLIDKGVLGFKAFLTHSGIDEFPNVSENDLGKAMPLIAAHGLPLLVHCELSEDNDWWLTADKYSYRHYLASRPKEWEDKAIAMMIRLCETYRCKVHIVHLSSANSIHLIKKAKEKGLLLTVETAQHYLYFNAENIKDRQTLFKCAPPIRESANNEQLWQALKDGIIDFIATDHSPAPPASKSLDSGDFSNAWGGISSLQFALPIAWSAARKRDCSLTDIARWLCQGPAALIGKSSAKGSIAKGYDADLVVWKPEQAFTVTEDIIRHKHKPTPYIGEQLWGVVTQTYIAGEKVFENGQLVRPNRGNIIVR